MSDPTLALPFDQYQRYRLVADILEDLRPGKDTLEVLDVGGRTALLRLFLPKDRVFLVDVEASDESGLVLGDGSALPYRDASVDAVVAFDTLEHVPPKRRKAFLAECRRVARRWVVLAGPYATEGVARAEALLSDFLHEKLGVEHRYLAEHASHGLPNLKKTEAALGGKGAKVVSIGHANLDRWLALMCLELYMDRDAPLRPIAAKYYEFYNASLYASDHAPPVYRHAVVAAYGGAELPSSTLVHDEPVAPTGAFDSVQNLLGELLAFDAERDVVAPEWERLEKVNADLHLDLEGHKDTLMILHETNVEQKKVIDELRQHAIDVLGNEDELLGEIERERDQGAETARTLTEDLEQHRKKVASTQKILKRTTGNLEALEAEYESLKTKLETERSERADVITTLEEDLSGHRQVVSSKAEEVEHLTVEARRLEAALEFERSEHAEVTKTLNEDLAGHRKLAEARTAEVERLTEEARRLEAALEYERGEHAEVTKTLDQDLAGHRKLAEAKTAEVVHLTEEIERLSGAVRSLEATLEQTRSEQAEVTEALSRDLAGHREVVANQGQELERRRVELEAAQLQQRELERAVEEQRARAAEFEALVAPLRGEISALETTIGKLTTELAQRDGTISELVARSEQLEARVHRLNTTLDEKQSALDLVRGELTGHRQVIESLRTAQRDRWANLLRALGLK